MNFQISKLDLEKEQKLLVPLILRGTRDQIPNICWIIKKAREFQETSTSASLTTSKPLTVWITTNCGKERHYFFNITKLTQFKILQFLVCQLQHTQNPLAMCMKDVRELSAGRPHLGEQTGLPLGLVIHKWHLSPPLK